MAKRGWGYWTEAKLDILSNYLPAFTTASKKAGKTVYLDLFAGSAANQRRDTGSDLKGSPVRALETSPPLTKLYFFELKPVADGLRQHLHTQFPDRDFEVIEGDCNLTIDGVLDAIRDADLQWAPMFAFVDPYSTTPLAWETLGKLAAFKHGRKYKVELWLLFYGSAIPRLAGLKDSAQEASISRFFGSNEWVDIAKARNLGALNAEQARYEYTNLMRWRLEKVLRYKHTHTLEVKNTSGAYLYNLIFATDNPTGDKIMGDIYRAALARNEKMRLEAAEIRREQRSGQAGMFGLDLVEGPAIDSDLAYVHEPPTPPYGAKASDDNG